MSYPFREVFENLDAQKSGWIDPRAQMGLEPGSTIFSDSNG